MTSRRRRRGWGTSVLTVALSIAPGCATDAAPERSPQERRLAAIDAALADHRLRAAHDEIESGLVESPDDLALLDRKLVTLRIEGNERAAFLLAQQLRARSPQDANRAYEVGELATQLGDRATARAAFEAAGRLAPDDWRPDVALATLALDEREPDLEDDGAIAHRLANWLDGPSARVEARHLAACLAERRGDRAGARARFERALELDPRHLPTLLALAHLVEAAGEKPAALALWRRALAATPAEQAIRRREIERRCAALEHP